MMLALGSGVSRSHGCGIDPWSVGVMSLGDIGTAANPYQSDFQSIAVVGGDAYFNLFSLHDIPDAGPGTGVSLYVRGSATITGAINNGGIEAGQDVTLNGVSVDGDVRAGGNLAGSGGHITGDVTLGGDKTTGQTISVGGTVTEGVPFVPTVDVPAIADYFLDTSATLGTLEPTVNHNNHFGALSVSLESGLNVVEIGADEFKAAWGFDVYGPADATLIVNIPDTTVSFDWIGWNFYNGVAWDDVLVNLPNAQSLGISSSGHVSLLAPNADTTFPQGLLTGNLVVGNLVGGGQVNVSPFGGGENVPKPVIPEPATVVLLVGTLPLVARHRRRKRGGVQQTD